MLFQIYLTIQQCMIWRSFFLRLQISCYSLRKTCCFGRPLNTLKTIRRTTNIVCCYMFFSSFSYTLSFCHVETIRHTVSQEHKFLFFYMITCTCNTFYDYYLQLLMHVKLFIDIICKKLKKQQIKIRPNVCLNVEYTPCVCWFCSVCCRHRPIQIKTRSVIKKIETITAVMLSPITTLFKKLNIQ